MEMVKTIYELLLLANEKPLHAGRRDFVGLGEGDCTCVFLINEEDRVNILIGRQKTKAFKSCELNLERKRNETERALASDRQS